MKLYEFFGVPTYETSHDDPRDALDKRPKYDKDKLEDDLYWYILDHDKLHKECWMPLAQEITEKIKNKTLDRKVYEKKFMPMVNKGCMEYYKEYQMTEDPRDVFPKDLRKGICQRLADQSFDDIEQEEYKLK